MYIKSMDFQLYIPIKDVDLGKIAKKPRLNPVGENVYLKPDGTIEKDEDKIIAAQRIFKHELYKPGGKYYKSYIKKYA
jgi:hypothetical protein